MTQRQIRGDILNDALKIINGERQDQYGNPEDSFAKEAYLTLKKMWWNESISISDFIEYIDDFLVSRDISKEKWDFIKWKWWLKDFYIHWSNDTSTKKPNYLLKFKNSPNFTFNQKQYAKR